MKAMVREGDLIVDSVGDRRAVIEVVWTALSARLDSVAVRPGPN